MISSGKMPADEVSMSSEMLQAILRKLPDQERQQRLQSGQARRRGLGEVGAALAIVAALIGGAVLEVLLSPTWVQLKEEETNGACLVGDDYSSCRVWRRVFSVGSTMSFGMSMVTLLFTLGGNGGCFLSLS
jgi:hypothetical protein